MRPIPVLLAIAALTWGVPDADPASAQCSVFSRHPCLPEPVYPFSEDLRLTIVSIASDKNVDSAAAGSAAEGTGADGEHRLDTIRDMFDALRACWVPPPQGEARPGMQMSVRLSFKRSGQMIGAPRVTYASPDAPPAARDMYHDAIMAALERCLPLRFTPGLGGAVAGRPIAIRYVDNRNAE